MVIGLDASGNFPANFDSDFGTSAVAAAVMPDATSAALASWIRDALRRWGREEVGELHAQPLDWTERIEACRFLGTHPDLRAHVVVTSALALGSEDAVRSHRERQLKKARDGRGRTPEGQARSDRAIRLLEGRRVSRKRLTDRDYVFAAMLPLAVNGAIQKAFAFFSGEEWRTDMAELRLIADDETGAAVRFVASALLPYLSDERFRLTTPLHWLDEPVHPLYERARHPDGDGYDLTELIGDGPRWVASDSEPAIQVADLVAWVVCRRLNRPDDAEAKECYELLQPILVGGHGECFATFALAAAKLLRATSLLTVNVALSKPARFPWHWAHVFEPELGAARVSRPDLFSAANVPLGAGSLQAEFYATGGRRPRDIARQFTRWAVHRDIFRDSDVVAIDESWLPRANVIHDHERAEAVSAIRTAALDQGVATAGRYGRWDYSLVGDLVDEASALADGSSKP